MTTTVNAVSGCMPGGGLSPIGSPILPGGTEAHIRKMILGNLYIADVEGHGLLAASPHWIVPAETVAPIMTAAGLELEPGSYTVYPTGRSKEPKVHRLDSSAPAAMIGQLMGAALAATEPVDQPELRAENGRLCRVNEGVYRIRAIGDATRPVAIWVEQYLNIRYLSAPSEKSVARRTCYVLMPVKFPAADG